VTRQKNATGAEDEVIEAPYVTIPKIKSAAAAGFRPCLFLDEIDKFGATEFRMNMLCEIVDAVWAANGQLICTSNCRRGELLKMWGPSADTKGWPILRRFMEGEDAQYFVFDSTAKRQVETEGQAPGKKQVPVPPVQAPVTQQETTPTEPEPEEAKPVEDAKKPYGKGRWSHVQNCEETVAEQQPETVQPKRGAVGFKPVPRRSLTD
jgi:hypothetical protein